MSAELRVCALCGKLTKNTSLGVHGDCSQPNDWLPEKTYPQIETVEQIKGIPGPWPKPEHWK